MATVGRDRELEAMSAFFGRDADGAGVLLMQGVPGIGKTTLWRDGIDLARSSGRTVLSCAAAAAETQLGLTALRDLLADDFDDVADELPGPQRRALDVTLLREEPGPEPPEPGAIAVAFLSTLRALARRAPTLVALDDLQWLDAASASTMAYALRRLGPEPVDFLVSSRPGATGALGLDPRDPRVETIDVGLLSVGALGRILHTRLAVVYPRPTLQRLHATANGNPLHALELARALGQTNQPLSPGTPLPVPAELRDLVRARLAALPDDSTELLVIASALPRPELPLVASALGHDPSRALRPALEAQVVEVEDGYVRFTHPLYAAAVYELASPARRREVHARLAPLVGDAEQRANHEALAADEADERVAGLVERGARLAFARASPTAAAELVAHALRLTPPDDAAALERRSLAQADYLFAAGDTAQADALVGELLRSATPGPARARLLSRRARIQHFAADIAASVDLLERALAEVGRDGALRGEIEEGLAWGLLLLRRDLPGAAEHARSAVDLAGARGDQVALAEALAALALLDFVLGRSWEGTMRRALELEPHMLGTRVLRHPSFAYGYCLSCSDRLDEARATFEALRARADEHGDEGSMPSLLNHLTLVELLAGNWPDAASLGDDCLERALESGQRPTQASVLGKLALLATRRGSTDEARERASRSLRVAAGDSFDPSRPERATSRGGETAIWALGVLELSLDDPEQAHRWLGPLVRSLLDAGVEEPGELRCLPDAIEALVALGSTTEAAALVERLEGWADRVDRPSVRSSAARSRALLLASAGDADGALASLGAAAAEGSQLPFERARTLLALGTLERRARRRRVARETLGAAVAAFEELGSVLWAERARAELSRIGGRAPSADGLTPTEQRIAGLVAEGKSNKEVAAALVVSVHTVESALTSVYRKLDVRSRTELAHRLAARD